MKAVNSLFVLALALLMAANCAAYGQVSNDSSNTTTGRIRVGMEPESTVGRLGLKKAKQKPRKTVTPPRRYRADRDAILEVNLCADQNDTMLYFITNTKRNWNYFRVTENARIIVSGINPEKEKISVNTVGLVNVYVVESSPLAMLSLTPPAESEEEPEELAGPPAPLPAEKKKEAEDAIEGNMDIISDYIKVLQERRSRLVKQACVNQPQLDSWLAALVPGTKETRFRLQSRQEREIAKLGSGNAVRIKAEAQLKTLADEVDKWMVLRGGNILLGSPMPVRDKDYIRFEVKRKDLATDAEVTLPHIDIPVYGNFRINVSSGLIFNRLVSQSFLAVNEDLAFPDMPDSLLSEPLKKVPVRENTPNVTLGLGVLAHFYHTSAWFRGNLAPALSAGATLNANGTYKGMVGGSLIIGGAQRLVLTAGVAIGQVDRLQKPYVEGKAYTFIDAEFPMASETRSSWFFGVTWNLSSNRNPVAN